MMAKATKDVTVTATPEPNAVGRAEFEERVIQLGIDLCEELKQGRIRKEASIIEAITNLYKTIMA